MNKTNTTLVLKSDVFFELSNTYGPSFPNGNPLPSVQVNPTIFAINVRNVRYSYNITPDQHWIEIRWIKLIIMNK